MNIAIDIDGVLTDLEPFMKSRGAEFFKKGIANQNGGDVDQIFGVSRKRCDDFWTAYYKTYMQEYPARENVGNIIKRLHDEGNKIYIVTARYFKDCYGFEDEEDMKQTTIDFLNRYGIPYDALHFYPSPKLPAVEDLDIDVFIEDDARNIRALSSVTKVVAYNASYNKHVNGPNIYRANDWNEIYDIIKTLDT